MASTARPESYVRPPLVAREAPPAWAARWRFRLAALLLLALLGALAVVVVRRVSGAAAQDPGVDALTPLLGLLG